MPTLQRKPIFSAPHGTGKTTLTQLKPTEFAELETVFLQSGLPPSTNLANLDDKARDRLLKRIDEVRRTKTLLTELPPSELRHLDLRATKVLAPSLANYWAYLTNARANGRFASPKEASLHLNSYYRSAEPQQLALGEYLYHVLPTGEL